MRPRGFRVAELATPVLYTYMYLAIIWVARIYLVKIFRAVISDLGRIRHGAWGKACDRIRHVDPLKRRVSRGPLAFPTPAGRESRIAKVFASTRRSARIKLRSDRVAMWSTTPGQAALQSFLPGDTPPRRT